MNVQLVMGKAMKVAYTAKASIGLAIKEEQALHENELAIWSGLDFVWTSVG
jgi:hypothetical protein